MQTQPFKPFRIVLSDCRRFDVPNHDAAFVKRNSVEVGLDLDDKGFARRSVECSILHITSIEELRAA
jgi:hypothetical protein